MFYMVAVSGLSIKDLDFNAKFYLYNKYKPYLQIRIK